MRQLFTMMLAGATTVAGIVVAGAERLPLSRMPDIEPQALLAHIKVLASDEYEGRLPGTKGEALTVRYLVDQFKALGLEPGGKDGTFVQAVPLVGMTPAATRPLTFSKDGKTEALAWRDDFVAWTPRVADTIGLEGSELVFVGYGVQAPEFDWDDFKGVDVAGKTLVVLVGDPPVEDARSPGTLDPKAFGGDAMTYYGRWTYKYEKGAERKAAAVLIVHETGPAGYGWNVVQGFGDERFDLRMGDGNKNRAAVEGWITLDRARQLFAMAGRDFDALKKAAVRRDFAPVPLGVSAAMQLKIALREVNSQNVIARLPGSDPTLRDESVVYTAHWDHLGVGEPVDGDRIYNGAQDNASGTAGLLELAKAFKRVAPPPKRSIVFLAVTAEEQGLLGSQFYAEHPASPLEKTLANINLDGLNVYGRTKDLTVIGLGNSDLDDYARDAAAEQGRVLRPDAEPEKGFYYRSDHFNFAKRGVPALHPDQGVEYVGKPARYGLEVRDDYTRVRYHRPQDEVLPNWDLSGAAEDLELLMAVGYRVANADAWPAWKPGTEFKAIREKALSGTR